jgi:hypothetical protein
MSYRLLEMAIVRTQKEDYAKVIGLTKLTITKLTNRLLYLTKNNTILKNS